MSHVRPVSLSFLISAVNKIFPAMWLERRRALKLLLGVSYSIRTLCFSKCGAGPTVGNGGTFHYKI